MKTSKFSQQIIGWYQLHKRDLPWRNTNNPYFIWLSEIILQQTRVAQGLPYYEKFIAAFPTVGALANAPQQEVLRLWQGLGYYSRARNLHETAKLIVENFGSEFPKTYAQLIKLKGIGPYTAAAVASLAFGEAVAVVDGNVYRVLARVFGVEDDIASGAGQKKFSELANELIDTTQSSLHNSAIMEFGALQCQPASPDCIVCPLQLECVARNSERIQQLPVKSKKLKIKERFFNYFVIVNNSQVVLNERIEKNIWQGLYDFYLIETSQSLIETADEFDGFLQELLNMGAVVSEPSEVFTHLLTHQRIRAQFWKIELKHIPKLPPHLSFYSDKQVENLPKPILIDNYLKKYYF